MCPIFVGSLHNFGRSDRNKFFWSTKVHESPLFSEKMLRYFHQMYTWFRAQLDQKSVTVSIANLSCGPSHGGSIELKRKIPSKSLFHFTILIYPENGRHSYSKALRCIVFVYKKTRTTQKLCLLCF